MKILWHGNFLDGKLSLVLPETDSKYQKCLYCGTETTVIQCVIISCDFQYNNHIHLNEEALKNFTNFIPALLKLLAEDYTRIIFTDLIEKIKNGEQLH